MLVNEDEDDHRLVAPSLHPLDPMDRTAHKVVVVAVHEQVMFKQEC